MVHTGENRETLTRRDYVKFGGAVVGGGLLAGCVGSGSSGTGKTDTENTDETNTDGGTSNANGNPESEHTTSGSGDTPYSVTMAPVGERKFKNPPTGVIGEWGFVADTLTALGHPDAIIGMARPSFWFTGFYKKLPGVSVPEKGNIPATLTRSYRVNKELLYELNPDLIAADPNKYISLYGVEKNEITQFNETIAPFFGNQSLEKRPSGWPNWPVGHDYPYYSIHEFIETYGEVFQEQKRATALTDLYTNAMETIPPRVPPKDKRPSIGLLSAYANPEEGGFFGVFNPIPELPMTYGMKQYGDLKVIDAFADKYGGSSSGRFAAKIDFEELLDVDPDVLIFKEAVTTLGGDENVYGSNSAFAQTLDVLKSDPVGQQLTAVKNNQLYAGGTSFQGPIINLFQTEMLAKQLYPEAFGTWPGFDNPIPKNDRLFDRQRLADIINGNL